MLIADDCEINPKNITEIVRTKLMPTILRKRFKRFLERKVCGRPLLHFVTLSYDYNVKRQIVFIFTCKYRCFVTK